MKFGLSLESDSASLRSKVVPSPLSPPTSEIVSPDRRGRRRRRRRPRRGDPSSLSSTTSEVSPVDSSDSSAVSAEGIAVVSETLLCETGCTSEPSASGQTSSSSMRVFRDFEASLLGVRKILSAAIVLCATASSRGRRSLAGGAFGVGSDSKTPKPKSSDGTDCTVDAADVRGGGGGADRVSVRGRSSRG